MTYVHACVMESIHGVMHGGMQYARVVMSVTGLTEDHDFPRHVITTADDYLWFRVCVLACFASLHFTSHHMT